MGFAPTRSFTIDVADFHPSVDHVKALGGAVDLGGEDRAKTVPPEPDRLVAHLDPALVEKLLYIA